MADVFRSSHNKETTMTDEKRDQKPDEEIKGDVARRDFVAFSSPIVLGTLVPATHNPPAHRQR
jgi:hypothetical protein